MLHIILMILKILGILLLILLGVVLAVVLAVLFSPVCYSVQGKKEGDRLSGKVRVSWIFSLLSARMVYEEGSPRMEIFLLGIPLLKLKRILSSWKRKHPKKAGKPKSSPAKAKEAGDEKIIKKRSVPVSPEKSPVPRIEDAGKNDPDKKRGRLAGIWMKIRTAVTAFLQIPSKVKAKFGKIRLTFKGFCDKIKQWRRFLKMETTRRAWRFLRGEGKLLLKHILPRKVLGRLRFGFDDPSLTGRLLAAAGMFYPLYKERFTLIPVFDEAVLEGEVKLKGRILGGYLLWQAWKIYRNRDVRITYQRFQHKEA